MKELKRILSLFMMVVMLFGLIPADAFAADIYKATSSLTDQDKIDDVQANMQVAVSQDEREYLNKYAEWTDKENGKAQITLTTKKKKAEETTVFYAISTCIVHGITEDILKQNIAYLNTLFDHVDIGYVMGNIPDGEASAAQFREYEYDNTRIVQDAKPQDVDGIIGRQHSTMSIYNILHKYLMGSKTSKNQVRFPDAIVVSADSALDISSSYPQYSGMTNPTYNWSEDYLYGLKHGPDGIFGYSIGYLPNPSWDCWDVLKQYKSKGDYYTLIPADEWVTNDATHPGFGNYITLLDANTLGVPYKEYGSGIQNLNEFLSTCNVNNAATQQKTPSEYNLRDVQVRMINILYGIINPLWYTNLNDTNLLPILDTATPIKIPVTTYSIALSYPITKKNNSTSLDAPYIDNTANYDQPIEDVMPDIDNHEWLEIKDSVSNLFTINTVTVQSGTNKNKKTISGNNVTVKIDNYDGEEVTVKINVTLKSNTSVNDGVWVNTNVGQATARDYNSTLSVDSPKLTRVGKGKIIVKHVNESGTDLVTPEEKEGTIDGAYTTGPKTISGYMLKTTPTNATGSYKATTQTITYVYRPDTSTVTVKHVNESGASLAADETKTGVIGTEYQTSPKNISGYLLKTTPTNSSGTFTAAVQTVTYVYKKAPASVVIKHVDENGNNIIQPENKSGNVGDSYTTAARNFTDYTLKTTPSNATGTMTATEITVTYVYNRNNGTVIVKHVDESGNSLAAQETKTGKVGDTYETVPKNIANYALKTMPANARGTFLNTQQTVTYVYAKIPARIIVKHVDTNGNSLVDDETKTGSVGESYETAAKAIPNYTLKTTPANKNGSFTSAPQTVTYIYDRNQGNVTVKHVDESGTALSADETKTGYIGYEYTTSPKNIAGYMLKVTPSNANGTFQTAAQTVTYIYQKAPADILIKHVDENGASLIQDEVKSGLVGAAYTTSSKSISGYTLKTTPANANGTFQSVTQTVTYVYQKAPATVIVRHVDEQGTNLANIETKTGKVGEPYDSQAKTIPGYTIKVVPENANGSFTVAQQTVTYVYGKTPTSVLVKHVDESGKDLVPALTLTGTAGDDYTTEAEKIYGYTLKKAPENKTGKMTNEEITVTYVYAKSDATITVKYVDENGSALAPQETKTGKVGEGYETQSKTIPGYTLKTTPTNATGTYTVSPQTVTYTYKKAPAKVIVKHVDESGNDLVSPEEKSGNVGDSYTTSSKTFSNYTLKTTPTNASGSMTSSDITVTYVYRLNDGRIVIKHVDEEGNALTEPENKTGKVGYDYTTSPKEFPGYVLKTTPNNATGKFKNEEQNITYVYKKAPSMITIKHTNEEGNSLVPDETKSGFVGDSYTTSPKTILGYKVKTAPENKDGVFKVEDQTVTYVYEKLPSSIVIRYVDEQGHLIANDDHKYGKVGDGYETEPKDIESWILKTIPGNNVGKFTVNEQVVTYVYEKAPAKVIVKHVDESGLELLTSKAITGKIGEPYTTNTETISGYVLKTTPSNASGTMNKPETIVVYVYEKAPSKVTVHYTDEGGNSIAPDKVIIGKVGEGYESNTINIPGYTVKTTPLNAKGTMTVEDIEVTYVYKKAPSKVTVKHVDNQGKDLIPPKEITGVVGENYNTEKLDFTGYTLKEEPSNKSGTMGEAEIVVTYMYTPAPTAVVVLFEDEYGKTLHSPIDIEGNVNDTYQTAPEDIVGYRVKTTPKNAYGNMTPNPITVLYVYEKTPSYVEVTYKSEDGSNLAPPEKITGVYEDPYSTDAKTFKGYILKENPENASGKMGADPTFVNYVYEKEPASVTSVYLDMDGNPIIEPDVITGKYLDTYKVEPRPLDGYRLFKVEGDPEEGTMYKDKKISYIYEKLSTISYLADEGGQITGKEKEVRSENEFATGSAQEANAGYTFRNWTVDTDVTLKDGTSLPKGSVVTMEDIMNTKATKDITFTAHYDIIPILNISKEADSSAYNVDDEIKWTITVSNAAKGSTAKNVVVMDNMPLGVSLDRESFTIEGASKAISPSAYVTDNGFSIPVGDITDNIVTITFKATADKNVVITGAILNTAEVSMDNGDPESDESIIDRTVSIKTSIEHGIITPPSGEIPYNSDYPVTYTPDEGYQISEIYINGISVDIGEFPDGVDFEDIRDNQDVLVICEKIPFVIQTYAVNGTIDESTVVLWGDDLDIAYKPLDGFQLLRINVDGEDVDVERFKDAYPFKDIREDHSIIVEYERTPNLKVEKTTELDCYNVGDEITYTITVTQTVGDAEARNVRIIDNLPKELKLVKDSIVGDIEIKEAKDNSYEVFVPSIKDSISFTYKAVVTEASSAVENMVIARSENTPNDAVDKCTIGAFTPEAKIEKTADIKEVESGDIVTYTIVAKQLTEGAVLRNAVIEDVLPEGLELVQGDAITIEGDSGEILSTEEGKVIISIPELKSETIVTIKCSVVGLNGEIKNIASLTSDDSGKVTSEETINIKDPILRIEKTVSKDKAEMNDVITYTIKGTSENAASVNAVIEDRIPAGLELIPESVIIKAGNESEVLLPTFTIENGVLVVNIERLKGDVYVMFDCKVAGFGMDIKNIATFTSANNPGESVEDSIDITATKPTLKISKDVDKRKASVGESVKYTVIASSQNGTAFNVVIKDRIPASLKLDKDSIKLEAVNGGYFEDDDIKFTSEGFLITFGKLKGDVKITYSAKVESAGDITNVVEMMADNSNDVVNDSAKINATNPPARSYRGGNAPRTGDETNLVLHLALLVFAITSVITIRLRFARR